MGEHVLLSIQAPPGPGRACSTAMSTVDPIPPGPRLIPSLSVRDAAEALTFYGRAFGFRVTMRLDMKDGRVGHAELELAGARFYLADEFPELDIVGPAARGGTTVSLVLHVEDVHATVKAATEAGALLEGEVKDEFYGARAARLRDPFGHRWMLQQRIEDLSEAEVVRRFEALEG
jgi:PhnB protein